VKFHSELVKLYIPLHGEARTHALCDTVMRLPFPTDSLRSFIHPNNLGNPYRIHRMTGQRSDHLRMV